MLSATEAPKVPAAKSVEAPVGQGQSSVKDWQAAIANAGYEVKQPAFTAASASSGTSK
jgi:hypothetical protein